MLQLFQAGSNGRKISRMGRQKIIVLSLVQNQTDLILIKEFLDTGKIAPVIDGCYPLNKVAEALWYFEREHPKGKVVITVEQDNKL